MCKENVIVVYLLSNHYSGFIHNSVHFLIELLQQHLSFYFHLLYTDQWNKNKPDFSGINGLSVYSTKNKQINTYFISKTH